MIEQVSRDIRHARFFKIQAAFPPFELHSRMRANTVHELCLHVYSIRVHVCKMDVPSHLSDTQVCQSLLSPLVCCHRIYVVYNTALHLIYIGKHGSSWLRLIWHGVSLHAASDVALLSTGFSVVLSALGIQEQPVYR